MTAVPPTDLHNIAFSWLKESAAAVHDGCDTDSASCTLRTKTNAFEPNSLPRTASRCPRIVSAVSCNQRRHRHLPLEVTSRAPVSIPTTPLLKKPKSRDPRFSDLSGTLNPDSFAKAYSFCDDLLTEEKKELTRALRSKRLQSSVEEKDSLKRKLDQINAIEERRKRVTAERNLRSRLKKEEKQRVIETGKMPFVYSKGKVKRMLQEDKFEKLKKENKLTKHLVRKRKKQASKEESIVPLQRRYYKEEDQ